MVSYNRYGNPNGQLLLFLHGGGVGGWMWERQVRHFSDCDCVVPELVTGDETFSIDSSARRWLRFIEAHAQGKRVIVVGFSLGAQVLVAMLGLQSRSQRIHDAMINSALVGGVPFAGAAIRSMKLAMPLVKRRWFAKLQAKSMYIGDVDFERYYRDTVQMSWTTFAEVMTENMSFTIPEGYSEAETNVLVTVGAREKNVMKRSMNELLASRPNSVGIVIPDVGHGAPLAKPESFNRLLEAWIRGEPFPAR
ncbi:alpha/beta hydrolase [Paenibacillus antri]|uniref:Alpha/beta hydrolase n=1 Tax=Paenibacillus antri TaxID=2582848 RepID=A0A5R9G1I9_9BACL|nr:alpha/beta hydrolase [Paenibacillus antri]TLS50207.1 alpha/beta hydrolase [Paenibacillus antri]